MTLRGPLVLGLVLVLARPASAQKAEADAAFRRGRELMAKGDIAGACSEFETSMRLEPLNGTLYNLAMCHERLGKSASAWTELKELADNDTNAARAKDAAKRAAALERKLTRMHIQVTQPVDGLVIKRNDLDVTALANQDVPVDPGRYTFVASAPGKKPLTLELDLQRPGETVAVAIPELATDSPPPETKPASTPFALSAFALPGTLRPLALPSRIVEADAHAEWGSSPMFERDYVDTVVAARMGVGPVEAQLGIAFHTRYREVTTTRPSLVHSVLIGASYVITPLFTAGVSYKRNHLFGGGIDEGGDLRGGATRKLILMPQLAVTGFGGFSWASNVSTGSSETNEFALAATGVVQFAPLSRLTLDAVVDFLVNLGGTLRSEVLDLDVGAGVSVAIDGHTDVYARVLLTALPSTTDLRMVLFGVVRRFP